MDRGYDSEAIHRQIREDLNADSIIPLRSWNNEIIGGTYRQEMAAGFDDAKYRRRQLVENKFSVLKRKFSGDLKARTFGIQMKEIANKMIVCNIHRFLQFFIIEVFYKAKFLGYFEINCVRLFHIYGVKDHSRYTVIQLQE
jgi:hypothetical protein